MDLLNKIDLFLNDQVASGATTTGNVEKNLAKGHVDVVGGKCPKGQVYCSKRKVCVPAKNESGSVSAMVAGSGQTRIMGNRMGWMMDLDRKEPVTIDMDDQSMQNILGRKGLKFDIEKGAYVPKGDTKEEPRYID